MHVGSDGVMGNVITHAQFQLNRLSGYYGDPNFPISYI